jgi:hypothetical protein
MRAISVGSECNVKYQIDKHKGKSETLFFDWLITDMNSVIKLISCDSIDDILNINTVKVDPVTPIIKSNSQILITSLPECISIHDMPIDPTDKDIDDFINKYKRRYERLINYIKSNDEIYFIRHGDVDDTNKQLFIQTIQSINKNCKFTLVLIRDQQFNSINRNANLLEINVISNPPLIKDWTTNWLDWKSIFDTIEEGRNKISETII